MTAAEQWHHPLFNSSLTKKKKKTQLIEEAKKAKRESETRMNWWTFIQWSTHVLYWTSSLCWCVPPYLRDLRRFKTHSPSARSVRYKACLLNITMLLQRTALRSGLGDWGLEMKKVICFHFNYTCFTHWHISATAAWKLLSAWHDISFARLCDCLYLALKPNENGNLTTYWVTPDVSVPCRPQILPVILNICIQTIICMFFFPHFAHSLHFGTRHIN